MVTDEMQRPYIISYQTGNSTLIVVSDLPKDEIIIQLTPQTKIKPVEMDQDNEALITTMHSTECVSHMPDSSFFSN